MATQSSSYKPGPPVLGGSAVPADSLSGQGQEVHGLSSEGFGVQGPRTPPAHAPSSLPKEEGPGHALRAQQWQQLQAKSLVASPAHTLPGLYGYLNMYI